MVLIIYIYHNTNNTIYILKYQKFNLQVNMMIMKQQELSSFYWLLVTRVVLSKFRSIFNSVGKEFTRL